MKASFFTSGPPLFIDRQHINCSLDLTISKNTFPTLKSCFVKVVLLFVPIIVILVKNPAMKFYNFESQWKNFLITHKWFLISQSIPPERHSNHAFRILGLRKKNPMIWKDLDLNRPPLLLFLHPHLHQRLIPITTAPILSMMRMTMNQKTIKTSTMKTPKMTQKTKKMTTKMLKDPEVRKSAICSETQNL